MKLPNWLLPLIGIAAFVVSFQVGRSLESRYAPRSKTDSAGPKGGSADSTTRLDALNPTSKVSAADFGHMSFSVVYRAVQSASPATRKKWAKEIDQMHFGPRRASAICSFYKTLVQVDARTAAEEVANSKDGALQQIAISALIGAAPTSAMEDLAKVLIKMPPIPDRVTNYSVTDVISEWSTVDPAAVAKFFDQENSKETADCFPYLLENWAATDPEAANNWLERQTVSNQTESAVSALLTGWFSRDQKAAIEFALAHSGDERFLPSVETFGVSIFREDPDTARDFIERLPNRDEQQDVLQHIIRSTVTEVVPSDPTVEMPPADAVMKWELSFPRELWTDLGTLAAHWQADDSAGFTDWLSQLSTETKDAILADYCPGVHPSNESQVISLALQITNSTLREETLKRVVETLGASPEEIRDTLNKTTLSSAEKAYLESFVTDE